MELAGATLRTLTRIGDPNKRLNAAQTLEMQRLAQSAILCGTLLWLNGKIDEEDDSFLGRARRYFLRDILSPFQGMALHVFLSVPPAIAWVAKVSNAVATLVTGEVEKGMRALGREVPLPRSVNPFAPEKEPKKRKFQKAKFKREKDK
jgi:hypothetical protein